MYYVMLFGHVRTNWSSIKGALRVAGFQTPLDPLQAPSIYRMALNQVSTTEWDVEVDTSTYTFLVPHYMYVVLMHLSPVEHHCGGK